MENREQKDKKRHPLVKFLLVIGAFASSVFLLKMPKEKRTTLMNSFRARTKHGFRVLVDFCIPHERNAYKPKVFRNESVQGIILFVLILKVGLISLLFIFYPDIAKYNQDIRSAMYELINQYRVEKGVSKLAVNTYLETAAGNKGQDILDHNYFSHFGLDGTKPWQWLDTSSYNFKAMGENLAMDFLTSGSVFRAFQKSPTHDRNLINSAYDDIGIAVMNGYLDGHNTNVMVVFFGSLKTPTRIVQAVAPTTATTTVSVPTTTVTIPPKPVPTPVVKPTTTIPSTTTPNPIASTKTQTSTLAVIEVSNPILIAQKVVPATSTQVLGETVYSPVVFTENIEGGVVFSQGSVIQRVIAWSDRFFMGLLIALIMLTIINIIVKLEVQHAPIIANSLILVVVVSLAWFTHVHKAEALSEQIRILAESLFL